MLQNIRVKELIPSPKSSFQEDSKSSTKKHIVSRTIGGLSGPPTLDKFPDPPIITKSPKNESILNQEILNIFKGREAAGNYGGRNIITRSNTELFAHSSAFIDYALHIFKEQALKTKTQQNIFSKDRNFHALGMKSASGTVGNIGNMNNTNIIKPRTNNMYKNQNPKPTKRPNTLKSQKKSSLTIPSSPINRHIKSTNAPTLKAFNSERIFGDLPQGIAETHSLTQSLIANTNNNSHFSHKHTRGYHSNLFGPWAGSPSRRSYSTQNTPPNARIMRNLRKGGVILHGSADKEFLLFLQKFGREGENPGGPASGNSHLFPHNQFLFQRGENMNASFSPAFGQKSSEIGGYDLDNLESPGKISVRISDKVRMLERVKLNESPDLFDDGYKITTNKYKDHTPDI